MSDVVDDAYKSAQERTVISRVERIAFEQRRHALQKVAGLVVGERERRPAHADAAATPPLARRTPTRQ